MAASILTLPAELKLQILSELPVAEIQRARRVCHHFKDLIDLTENQGILLAPSLCRSRARLEHTFKTEIDVLAPDANKLEAFIAAFTAFYTRRGVKNTNYRYVMAPYNEITFAKVWFRKSTGLDADLFPAEIASLSSTLRVIIWAELALLPITKSFRRDVYPMMLAMNPEPNGFTKAELVNRISGPTELLAGVKVHLEETGGSAEAGGECMQYLPDFPLTKRSYPAGHHPVRDANCQCNLPSRLDRFSSAAISQMLGVRALASLEGSLLYCVKTEWAWEKVRETLEDGVALDAISKAAVMEELYVY